MNPADMLTRGLTFEKFKDINDLWMNGPAWICNENEWPVWNGNMCISLTTQQVHQLKMNLRKNMNQPKFLRIYISHRHKQFEKTFKNHSICTEILT